MDNKDTKIRELEDKAPKKQEEWEHRLQCLVENIQYWTENETNKTVEVVELFYDAN